MQVNHLGSMNANANAHANNGYRTNVQKQFLGDEIEENVRTSYVL